MSTTQMDRHKSYVIQSLIWGVVIIVVFGYALIGWLNSNETWSRVEVTKVETK